MWRSLLSSLAIILSCLAVAIAAFDAGRTGGPDLAVARHAGAVAGRQEGTQAGASAGRQDGYRAGFLAGYRPAYAAAYRRAYRQVTGR
jgi:hypothetical protein